MTNRPHLALPAASRSPEQLWNVSLLPLTKSQLEPAPAALVLELPLPLARESSRDAA